MKTVKVYGPGCKRCEATKTMVKDAASRLGIDQSAWAYLDQFDALTGRNAQATYEEMEWE